MRVSFDFDEVTKKVTNVTVEDGKPATKVVKAKKATESSKVVLNNTSLKLNQEVLDLLGLEVGDRVCINFTNTHPVLVPPKAAGEKGNLITKSLTVSCKGKASETLGLYGTEFDYRLESNGHVALTNEIVEATAQRSEIHEDLLDDKDFTNSILDGEEVHIDITI